MTVQPLKILIALQYYVPHRTGLTLHVQYIAEALAARGHQVTVLTARYHPSLPRDEQVINGVRVIRLWSPIRVSRGMIMPAYPWAALRLVQMHDVVSIHTPMLETAVFALYTRLFRKGLVITHHGDLILPSGVVNRFIQWFIFRLYKVAGRAANRILAYNRDYADRSYYIAPFREKTSAVYPLIVIPRPNPARVEERRAEWLAGTNSQGRARLIGYAGRFVEEKRPDVLILALPSDTECFALVQVEAMRCGTPVVATDIPGARVVVRKTGMGEIVPPGNPQAMGQAIVRILDNRRAYDRPFEAIDAAFNFEETVNRYERHLRDAAERARGQGR